jgi:hypothetical protein
MQQMKGCLTCLPAKAGCSENLFTESCVLIAVKDGNGKQEQNLGKVKWLTAPHSITQKNSAAST